MSLALTSLYAQQFATDTKLLLQQKGSKLESKVMKGSYVGKQASPVDQVGAISMSPVNGRFQAMGRTDAPVDRRWILPADYELNQLVDSFDKLRIISNPQSVYAQNAAYAAGRQIDDVIIAAMFGTALTGETASTSTSFLAANQVAVGFGGTGNLSLNVPKIREAKRLLMSNEVDFDTEEVTMVVTSKEHDALLSEVQIASLDYNDRPVLVEGRVTRFLGINIVTCERLPLNGSSFRRIPVFAKSGFMFGTWDGDFKTSISQRNDLSGEPWQIYLSQTIGATRLEEKKFVELVCA